MFLTKQHICPPISMQITIINTKMLAVLIFDLNQIALNHCDQNHLYLCVNTIVLYPLFSLKR